MTTKNLAVLDKIRNLVMILQKHKTNPSDKLFARVEKDLKEVELELKNSHVYLLDPDLLDVMVGKIHYMMEKNTKLAKKYHAQRFTGRS